MDADFLEDCLEPVEQGRELSRRSSRRKATTRSFDSGLPRWSSQNQTQGPSASSGWRAGTAGSPRTWCCSRGASPPPLRMTCLAGDPGPAAARDQIFTHPSATLTPATTPSCWGPRPRTFLIPGFRGRHQGYRRRSNFYWIVTVTAGEAMPLATTSIDVAPVSVFAGTSTSVLTVPGYCTPMKLNA